MLFWKISYAQQPFLTIHYLYAEKSRDSHSTTETISISGTTANYFLKFTGRKGPEQKDETKDCTLSKEQVSTIRKAIDEKKLNVADSLVDNSLPGGSYQVTTAITITFTNGNKNIQTKVKGKPSALNDKPLYKNAVSLLNLVRKMLENCH